MRPLHELERYRLRGPQVRQIFGDDNEAFGGAFEIPSPVDGAVMRVIATTGGGWDHVSVSRKTRCPNWHELERAKRMFFEDDETAVQFHVPQADHVNAHDTCLHLWRCQTEAFPRPPASLVGIGKTPIESLADANERLKALGLR